MAKQQGSKSQGGLEMEGVGKLRHMRQDLGAKTSTPLSPGLGQLLRSAGPTLIDGNGILNSLGIGATIAIGPSKKGPSTTGGS